MTTGGLDRRAFLAAVGSCAAHLAVTLAAGTRAARALFAAQPYGRVLRAEPWGRLEKLAEGAWALISTPLAGGVEAMRTFSNGGIIAGRESVLVVEGFASEAGARWLAAAARELTGRRPTHVVLTHVHGDHSGGLAGYKADGAEPLYVSTAATRADLVERSRKQGRAPTAAETLYGERVRLVESGGPVTLDLGDRKVRVDPRWGHTRSDLVVVLEDPRLVWCGDLVWNGFFPNYVDATPSELSRHVRALLEEPAEAWIPGHGSLADRASVGDCLALLDDVEAAARRAIEAGTPVAEAARAYRPRAKNGEWVLFSPEYYAVAFGAWERELGSRAG